MAHIPRIALLRALYGRQFALLWSGQTFSRVGDFLYQVALAWWVLEKTGSALAMGTVLIFSFTPMLLFLLIGGVAVDRLPRVPLMLASDLLRGVVVAVVALFTFTNTLEIWHIYLASLTFGFVDAFFQPAYSAMVPQIVPVDDLPSANSLSSISVQIGRILGPALAAALIAVGGTPFAFTFNSLTFFVSAAFLLPLLRVPAPRPTVLAEGEQKPSLLADLREGIATVLAAPVLWITIGLYALVNVTLAGPYSVAMPFLVEEHLHADASTLGFLYAMFPVGYVLGGVWLGRKARIRSRGLLMYGGAMVAGLMLFTFGLQLPVLVLGLAAIINGAALEMGSLAWTNTLQETVAGEKLGRVYSIDMLGSYVLLPIGYALTGWMTDLLGPATVFLLGGGITVVLAGLGLMHPRIHAWS